MTERFNTAVTKLYTAYHNGTLNAFDCMHCAVGNICKYPEFWEIHGYMSETYKTYPVPEMTFPKSTDYSNLEITQIEFIFLNEWAKEKSKNGHNKEIQFNGLCAVIEYLAELDDIPNPFDFGNLFNEDTEIAERELKNVLS